MNAIVHANRVDLRGATIYTTKENTGSPTNFFPCRECMKVILAAGIANIGYFDERSESIVVVPASQDDQRQRVL